MRDECTRDEEVNGTARTTGKNEKSLIKIESCSRMGKRKLSIYFCSLQYLLASLLLVISRFCFRRSMSFYKETHMAFEIIHDTLRLTNLPNEPEEYLAKREELRMAEIEMMRQIDG
jgi:hypothetical protein